MLLLKIKEFFAVKLFMKLTMLIVAVGFLPIIILIVGLGEDPDWIAAPEHFLEKSYGVTVEQEISILGSNGEAQQLRSAAAERIGAYAKKKASEQIAAAYALDINDAEQMAPVNAFLDEQIVSLPDALIREQDIYTSELSMKRYGLFSIERAELDAWLQGVYAAYNKQMLEAMGL